ncbi:PAS domain-containing sensor histidine kinase [Crenothrix polyspora]|uniref:histidine kinase n=1 Tax=Crenothrix polyspora TaxID=360316 RepID=A0A1R4GZL7_9GAMM|nr:PAS domain S-box protein [Crenothrix polyspora]SJM89402.1 Signal transduction histidine kinase, nitrogen specific, NtrB [Crenothrix polyspora]
MLIKNKKTCATKTLSSDVKTDQHEPVYNSFEGIFNLAPIGYLVLDKEGIIQHVNAEASRLMARTAHQLINKKMDDFINPIDHTSYHFFIRNFTEQQTSRTLEVRLKKECSPLTHLECRASIGGENSVVLLTISDITTRRQAEDAIVYHHESLSEKVRHQLLEREAKLNAIFNASIEGIVTIDTTGTIVSVNSAIKTIFGYTETELVKNNIDQLLPLLKQKRRSRYLKNKLHIFVAVFVGKIQEVQGMHKDGSILLLDLSIVQYSIDEINYFTGIVRDVSLRKQQEQQNKEHLEKLAHVTRLGVMGEMASGIAHEVNQPLTAVVNYTQVCLRYIDTQQPDLIKLSEVLHKTHHQALKAGQIIHSMREFVKPRKIHRATANINSLIYEAISLLDADLKQYSIKLSFELEKNLPLVYIDTVQIEQVIINLIRNSTDALRDLPPRELRLLSIQTHLNKQNYIEIKVKDNGSGLSDEQREKILTPFYTTKSTGMGMGLSISRSLVEAHEGALHFNSKQNKGTTFYFTLPVWKHINDQK